MMCGLTLWSQSRFVGFNDSITAATKDSILPTNNNDFHVAKRESLGFFDDIPSRTWDRMKEKVKDMSPNFNPFYLPFREGGRGSHQEFITDPKSRVTSTKTTTNQTLFVNMNVELASWAMGGNGFVIRIGYRIRRIVLCIL